MDKLLIYNFEGEVFLMLKEIEEDIFLLFSVQGLAESIFMETSNSLIVKMPFAHQEPCPTLHNILLAYNTYLVTAT